MNSKEYELICENIANQLKNLRKTYNLTQEEMIKKIGNKRITTRTYQNLEAAKNNSIPSIDTMICLSEAFGVPIEFFTDCNDGVFDDSFKWKDNLKRLISLVFSLALIPFRTPNNQWIIFCKENEVQEYLKLIYGKRKIWISTSLLFLDKQIDKMNLSNESTEPSKERLFKINSVYNQMENNEVFIQKLNLARKEIDINKIDLKKYETTTPVNLIKVRKVNNIDIKKMLAKQLRKLRKVNNESQEDVYYEVSDDVSLRTYRSYESGKEKNNPALDKIIALSKHFKTSIDYLVMNKNVVLDKSYTWQDCLKRLNRLLYSLIVVPVLIENEYVLLVPDKITSIFLDSIQTISKETNRKFDDDKILISNLFYTYLISISNYSLRDEQIVYSDERAKEVYKNIFNNCQGT